MVFSVLYISWDSIQNYRLRLPPTIHYYILLLRPFTVISPILLPILPNVTLPQTPWQYRRLCGLGLFYRTYRISPPLRAYAEQRRSPALYSMRIHIKATTVF